MNIDISNDAADALAAFADLHGFNDIETAAEALFRRSLNSYWPLTIIRTFPNGESNHEINTETIGDNR